MKLFLLPDTTHGINLVADVLPLFEKGGWKNWFFRMETIPT